QPRTSMISWGVAASSSSSSREPRDLSQCGGYGSAGLGLETCRPTFIEFPETEGRRGTRRAIVVS
ncbi:hypothetical protein BDY19DRAFT_913874, partial [Irpex rosettiformis]